MNYELHIKIARIIFFDNNGCMRFAQLTVPALPGQSNYATGMVLRIDLWSRARFNHKRMTRKWAWRERSRNALCITNLEVLFWPSWMKELNQSRERPTVGSSLTATLPQEKCTQIPRLPHIPASAILPSLHSTPSFRHSLWRRPPKHFINHVLW